MRESVFLLHGFGGTHRAWDAVRAMLPGERYIAVAPDLPGHGAEPLPETVSFDAYVEHVLAIAPDRFVLCGYSMGGRIALNVALAAPSRVRRLVLISCTAGLELESERAARLQADELLAEELLAGPYEQFVGRWRAQLLFAGEGPEVQALAREDQLRNDPRSLAAVLRGLGTGGMVPLWERLGELRMPVSVLAGARDRKFVALAERMASLIPSAKLSIVPGGHALALEDPIAIALAIGEGGPWQGPRGCG